MELTTQLLLTVAIGAGLVLGSEPSSENGGNNGTCSKQWIRFMVVHACSYAKRGVFEHHFIVQTTEDELTKFFEHLVLDDKKDDIFDKLSAPDDKQDKKSTVPNERPEIIQKNPRSWPAFLSLAKSIWPRIERPKRSDRLDELVTSSDEIAGIPTAWLNKEEVNGRKLDKSTVRRDIRKLVEKCCTKLCTADDFKVVCG